MARAGGGRLAAAVSNAGGLGLIGGGYADPEWTIAELDEAGSAAVGVGFITWALESQPDLLDEVLARTPRAVMLSFGDPRDLGARVRAAGVPLICQVNDRADALLALAMWWSRRALRPAVTASTGAARSRLFPNLSTCSHRNRPTPCCARPAVSLTAVGSRPRSCSAPMACWSARGVGDRRGPGCGPRAVGRPP